jgi:hypothetical protein
VCILLNSFDMLSADTTSSVGACIQVVILCACSADYLWVVIGSQAFGFLLTIAHPRVSANTS